MVSHESSQMTLPAEALATLITWVGRHVSDRNLNHTDYKEEASLLCGESYALSDDFSDYSRYQTDSMSGSSLP